MKRRFLLYIFILLFMSGCIPKRETMHIYSLSVTSSHKASTKSNSTLKVNYPTSLNGVGGSRIYYSDNSRVGYYLYSRWSSSLNRMLYSNILANLQESGKYKYVVGYSSGAKADRELEVAILSFNHIIEGESSRTDIKIDAKLIDSKSGRVIKQKRFSYTTPLEAKSAAAFVKGAKEDMARFIDELIGF